jgi:hypothetical protein
VKIASDGATSASNIKVAVVPADTKVFRRLSDEEVGNHIG